MDDRPNLVMNRLHALGYVAKYAVAEQIVEDLRDGWRNDNLLRQELDRLGVPRRVVQA